jgi:acylphosphatase
MDSRRAPESARRVRVKGRVQGVFFRASTAERAQALAVRGYAENLPDGTVLVMAGGSESSLAALIQWLHKGPPMARVDEVNVESLDPSAVDWPAGFHQR